MQTPNLLPRSSHRRCRRHLAGRSGRRFAASILIFALNVAPVAIATAVAADTPGAVPTRGGPNRPPGAPPADDCAVLPAPALTWATARERLARCNRDLRLALRALDAARADILTASQRPNPIFNISGESISPASGVGAGGLLDKQIDYKARIDQTIERGGKRDLRVESAEQAFRAASWTAADGLRQRQLALANAWIDLWGAQERVALQQELIELFGRTADGARRRLKVGDIAVADVSRIELDLSRAESERTVAEGELARARNVLAALLGIEPLARSLRATEPWPATARGEPGRTSGADGGAAAASTGQRPDLLAARAQSAAADARRRLARSLQTRDVTVGLQSERYAPPAGNGWSFGLFFAVPLFVANNSEGEIARAQADREIAEQTALKLEREAYADRQRLLDIRDAARARRDRIERDSLPLARRVAADADLGFRKGAGTVLELLDSLRQLRALQLDALGARLDDDRSDAAARAEMLTTGSENDPVFGEALRWHPNR
jgi:cobalt-zinc-cadmium efflux system outer membrane protein